MKLTAKHIDLIRRHYPAGPDHISCNTLAKMIGCAWSTVRNHAAILGVAEKDIDEVRSAARERMKRKYDGMTDDERHEYNRKQREYMRKRCESDPEYRKQLTDYARELRRKKRESQPARPKKPSLSEDDKKRRAREYSRRYTKERYHSDPEYRLKMIERSVRYQRERYRVDPEYRDRIQEKHSATRRRKNERLKQMNNIKREIVWLL